MKVKELILFLQEQNPEDLIVLSKDSEGNSYSPLFGGECGRYTPETTWSGEVHIRELTNDLRNKGFTEADLTDSDDAVDAIVLWPTN